ncbi:MAG: esterase-like activity of phytase family protein [Sphingomonadaceae bacterium]|nr:esterase-like activity of phytase family protein [Sphingomonadaceae bacterium]
MRAFLLLALWVLLTTFTPRLPPRREAPPAISWIALEPVVIDPTAPGRTRFGGLRFLGGWSLASNDPRFGGLSALHVEGRDVLAFSDAGWRVHFPVPVGGRGKVRAQIGLLPDGPGASGGKSGRDVESMWVEGASLWLGLERRNAIWRFDRASGRATSDAEPAAMARWPKNRGPEAMLRLRDGRFLVFAEGKGEGGEVILFAGDPAVPGTPAKTLRYLPPAHYRTTDAALLPDGHALILNRRWTLLQGFTSKLTLVDLAGVRAGAVLRGREIADFRPPLLSDNFEGLSVTREGGRTIVWMTSDDNYVPLQRTLLLKFAFAG